MGIDVSGLGIRAYVEVQGNDVLQNQLDKKRNIMWKLEAHRDIVPLK